MDAYDGGDTTNLWLQDLLEHQGDDWVLVDNHDSYVQYCHKDRVYQKQEIWVPKLFPVAAFRERGDIDEDLIPGTWYLADRICGRFQRWGHCELERVGANAAR